LLADTGALRHGTDRVGEGQRPLRAGAGILADGYQGVGGVPDLLHVQAAVAEGALELSEALREGRRGSTRGAAQLGDDLGQADDLAFLARGRHAELLDGLDGRLRSALADRHVPGELPDAARELVGALAGDGLGGVQTLELLLLRGRGRCEAAESCEVLSGGDRRVPAAAGQPSGDRELGERGVQRCRRGERLACALDVVGGVELQIEAFLSAQRSPLPIRALSRAERGRRLGV
jgi:hypothetical protein